MELSKKASNLIRPIFFCKEMCSQIEKYTLPSGNINKEDTLEPDANHAELESAQDTELRDLENEKNVLNTNLLTLKDRLREPKHRMADEVDHLLNEIDETKIAIEDNEHQIRERQRELEEEEESERCREQIWFAKISIQTLA